jgi:hypothetical protein
MVHPEPFKRLLAPSELGSGVHAYGYRAFREHLESYTGGAILAAWLS